MKRNRIISFLLIMIFLLISFGAPLTKADENIAEISIEQSSADVEAEVPLFGEESPTSINGTIIPEIQDEAQEDADNVEVIETVTENDINAEPDVIMLQEENTELLPNNNEISAGSVEQNEEVNSEDISTTESETVLLPEQKLAQYDHEATEMVVVGLDDVIETEWKGFYYNPNIEEEFQYYTWVSNLVGLPVSYAFFVNEEHGLEFFIPVSVYAQNIKEIPDGLSLIHILSEPAVVAALETENYPYPIYSKLYNEVSEEGELIPKYLYFEVLPYQIADNQLIFQTYSFGYQNDTISPFIFIVQPDYSLYDAVNLPAIMMVEENNEALQEEPSIEEINNEMEVSGEQQQEENTEETYPDVIYIDTDEERQNSETINVENEAIRPSDIIGNDVNTNTENVDVAISDTTQMDVVSENENSINEKENEEEIVEEEPIESILNTSEDGINENSKEIISENSDDDKEQAEDFNKENELLPIEIVDQDTEVENSALPQTLTEQEKIAEEDTIIQEKEELQEEAEEKESQISDGTSPSTTEQIIEENIITQDIQSEEQLEKTESESTITNENTDNSVSEKDNEQEKTENEETDELIEIVEEVIEDSVQEEITEEELPAETSSEQKQSENEYSATDQEEIEDVTLTESTVTHDGYIYTITAVFSADSGINDKYKLNVSEIYEAGQYDSYVEQTEAVLQCGVGELLSARFFDINVVDETGTTIQPREGSSINLNIHALDIPSENLNIIHFEEDKETEETTPKILETVTEGDVVSFETTGFSVYAIVESPPPVATGYNYVESMEEFNTLLDAGLYISHINGYYMTNEGVDIAAGRPGIKKTNKASSVSGAVGAVPYYFEVSGNGYNIYCYDNNMQKQYLQQYSTNALRFSNKQNATVFIVEPVPNTTNTFRIYKEGTTLCINQAKGDTGKAFGTWDGMNDVNAQLQFQYFQETEDDPYNLNGQTYGIAYVNDDAMAKGMSSSRISNITSGLSVEDLIVKTDPIANEGYYLVYPMDDITEWTFESVNADNYYLTTKINDVKHYITLQNGVLTLTETPDAVYSLVKVAPAETNSAYAGKVKLIINNAAIRLSSRGGQNQIPTYFFNTSTTVSKNSYLSLVREAPEIIDDDFLSYVATKQKISDTEVITNKTPVVIYTRKWNSQLLQYDYFVLDYNGTLVPALESVNKITWNGSSINTAVWEFTEYYYEGTDTPNYYYDLQNVYTGKYLAPQLGNAQIFSDAAFGVNMYGRKYGDESTAIVAWDDPYYDYAGLKVDGNRIVVCPFAEAEQFFFATPDEFEEGVLHPIPTIDNNEYGIQLKIIDYNGAMANNRNAFQTSILGHDTDSANLLSKYLEEDTTNPSGFGYPLTNTEKTHTAQQHSLAEMFQSATDCNHLFSLAKYAEDGYFEYNSTQNFAYLEDGENFTVYSEIATVGASPEKLSLNHGQFFPFNTLINPKTGEIWEYSTMHQNTTDTLANELPDSNPRKYEKLIEIPFWGNEYPETGVEAPYRAADYFFGMEMETAFTQTENGLDAFGNNIIFEFSGDDDMWLYVDGVLVLDLGGVHTAMSGKIDFSTGLVTTSNRGNSNLRQLFTESYMQRYPNASQAELDDYLAEYFNEGEDIFKAYSRHDVKMFYMERGAGASNLHLKFNLSYVVPNEVILKKSLSGTDQSDYEMADFPFQIWYATEGHPEYMMMTQDALNPSVVYKNTHVAVPFYTSYTPSGSATAYNKCFLLKPTQEVEILFPDDVISYYIVECGVNNEIYDGVKANNQNIDGTLVGNRYNYAIEPSDVDDRPIVEYDNHVSSEALRTLTITKQLYAEDGTTLIMPTQDNTGFQFRLYLGGENDDTLTLANMYPYYIKNAAGEYCRWDYPTQSFVSLHKQDFDALTEAEKQQARFITSSNGAISKIPSTFSVEVRDLLIGTKFMIVERESEIPTGYKLMDPGYVRVAGSYIIEDGDDVNAGKIRDNNDPSIEIHNQRGWSLTVQKVWSDEAFMDWHDNIYIAVYDTRTDTLIPNTVKEMPRGTNTVSYYFDNLLPNASFSDYIVREVVLTGAFTVDADGFVDGYTSITPVQPNEPIEVEGKATDDDQSKVFTYTASYETGTAIGVNHHVRTDIVTNTRPGLKIVKTDEQWEPLSNAVFELKDSNDVPVGDASYTSDAQGVVTIAYLPDGTYSLQETRAPHGYQAIQEPIQIEKDDDVFTVSGIETEDYQLTTEGDMTILKLKNKPYTFSVLKIDGETNEPMEGVKFAVHRQVQGNNGPRKDYFPVTGYEQLTTNTYGYIDDVLENLPVGTYYLVEKETLQGFKLLQEDICFSISNTGVVSMEPNPEANLKTTTTTTHVHYEIKVINISSTVPLSVTKQVTGNLGSRDKQFYFTLQLSSASGTLPDTYQYTKGDTSGGLVLHDGALRFSLSHDETIIIEGIPSGTSYTLVEDDYSEEGYQIESEENPSGQLHGADMVEAIIVNHKSVAIPTDIFDTYNSLWLVIAFTSGCAFLLLCLAYKKKSKKK